eukprot:829910-Prorocentrum_lima.AAC.1
MLTIAQVPAALSATTQVPQLPAAASAVAGQTVGNAAGTPSPTVMAPLAAAHCQGGPNSIG